MFKDIPASANSSRGSWQQYTLKGGVFLRILINTKVSQEHVAKIETGFPTIEVRQTDNPEEARELVKGSEILVTWKNAFQPEFWESSGLRWVHLLSAGIDGLVVPPTAQGRVLLTNSRGIHGIPISEHVFALMLAFSRGLNQYGRNQTQRKWRQGQLTELRGKTLGIVGFGSIGREIARLGAAFGMRVLVVKRSPGAAAEVSRVVGPEGLEMVLKESDYLVLALPLTAESRRLLGARELELMKPSAILINIARGEIVNEEVLARALEQKVIAGAGLDVFEAEPLPPDSPLWQLDNCIITPHCAALSPQYMTRATDLFCRNLDAYINGDPLPTAVDLLRGY